jgi:hypothetical protein
MKHNKTHKRNKNNKKLNLKGGKINKGKTKKGKIYNKITGGIPSVKVIPSFTKKNNLENGDVNRFEINIRSHFDLDDYLYQAEDFLKRFELDLLNYTDKNEYELMKTEQKKRTKTVTHEFTIAPNSGQ